MTVFPGTLESEARRGISLGNRTCERPANRPLPKMPYLPLQWYGPEHRALFAGRDGDIERFAMTLDNPDTRVLILHGESGVGKSSFLRAGVIPFLEGECIGFQFLKDRGADGADAAASTVLFLRDQRPRRPARPYHLQLCDGTGHVPNPAW